MTAKPPRLCFENAASIANASICLNRMTSLVKVCRAIISVSDKSGLVDFARTMCDKFGVAILSTGGTADALRKGGVAVSDISSYTE